MKTAPAPLTVKSASGALLELADGRQIIDCISSWWVNIHGHCHPYIADAIAAQAHKLEQVIFAGFTHEPAMSLVAKLQEQVPPSMTRCFFSDNGSTSVEVAIKMCHQYFSNLGDSKRKSFIGFEGGYHGDTVGAMSAGQSSPFWSAFASLLFPIDVVPYPFIQANNNIEAAEADSLKQLAALLEKNPGSYAGIIIEPLVQGAAGMRMCRPQFLKDLRALADEFSVLLIFDEVMTGFGRTGDWFACVKAAVHPDIICLSKGITGGFLPLAVTMCQEKIYEAFLSEDMHKAFFHSHSYTANPIACAAAVASMELLQQNQSMFKNLEARHQNLAKTWLADHKGVSNLRFCGTIVAMEFVIQNQSPDYFSAIGPHLRKLFLEAGLLIRPLGNTVYLMPPYCISDDELTAVYSTMRAVLDAAV